MSEIKPTDYTAISELLDDGSLRAIRWVPGGEGTEESARVEAVIDCLRGTEGDEAEGASSPLTLAFSGATALGFSFEPGRKRPSETSWPSATQCAALLSKCEGCNLIYFAHDNKEWFSDALSAPGLAWAHGDEGVFAAAPRTFIFALEQVVRIDGCMHAAWILIAAAGVTALDTAGPLTIESWSDQYCRWWKGWKKHWDNEEASEGEPGPFSAAIPAAEEEDHSGYTPPTEPIFELEPHDLPGDLCAAARAWFEKEHQPHNRESYDPWWLYARSVESWWVEGARAKIDMLGIQHTMPTEGDPPENEINSIELSLARRDGTWVVTQSGTGLPDADDANERPWAIAWKGGRLGSPPIYVRLLYKLKHMATRSQS